jgi:hypothetical protein
MMASAAVTFESLEVDSPKTRAQGVLEEAQAPPSAAPDAPAAAAETVAAAPGPTTPRGWLGVAWRGFKAPYTNAMTLRDAPSELWVCFWCAFGSSRRPTPLMHLLPPPQA